MSIEIYPEHSKTAVNKAGRNLARGEESQTDLDIIANWRAAHNHILNTFQANLRRRAKSSNVRTPVQRIKRLDTITNKLIRFPNMQLARMHDIVGCRLIFENLDELHQFRKDFNKSRFLHKRRMKRTEENTLIDAYDYILIPKPSGYRGIHDVFEYRSKQSGAKKLSSGEKWNGLNIEIQYRTRVQHAWATAVEICDKFTDNHGKFSNAPEDYLEYFVLASELLSRHFEPSTPDQIDLETPNLIDRFNELEARHGMLQTLRGVQASDDEFETSRNTLLIFDDNLDIVEVQSFTDFRTAVTAYFELERTKKSGLDVVLVAADDPESVRFGFKNYFSDAREFVSMIEEARNELDDTIIDC